MITKLTVADVEYISFRLAKEIMGWNEPIPDFQTRFPNILESSLRVPFQTFDGKNLYKGLIDKAAILFYLMIKNHPFRNGNKRIAMITLFVFLFTNGKWLKVDNRELYSFAVWVAESNAMFQEGVVTSVRKFLMTYLVDR
jgi:death-on-curing family protein